MRSQCIHCGEPIIRFISKCSDVWLHVWRTHAKGAEKCLDAPRVAEPAP